MKNKKQLMLVLLGTILAAGMTGCGTAAALQAVNMVRMGEASSWTSQESSTVLAVCTGDSVDVDVNEDAYGEQFKIYESFGITYDENRKELYYGGRAVRWFEDYYSVEEGAQAGTSFFNENGVVDVYAVRDFNNIVRFADGSYDPSGKLMGVAEFSEEEFASRDLEALKNPALEATLAGGPLPSAKELEDMAKEYEEFGLTYDAKEDQWYFEGEKVRYFQDVLTSNGENLTKGGFHGSLRTSWSEGGTVDVYTVRDHANPNASGDGTLTGVEKFSQEEFDEHTRSCTAAQSSSGTCIVTQE